MKGVMALIAFGLVIMMFGGVMFGLDNFRGKDFTEPHIFVSGEGITTVTYILANPVMDSTTANVLVVSSIVDDAPVPFQYTAVNRQLVINGLAASDNRTLTITYKVARLDAFTDTVAHYIPAFLLLGGLAIIGAAAYSGFQNRGD